MNLPVPKSEATATSQPILSTYTILLLSGVLFGMCVSGNLPTEVKTWFVFAGTIGLVAYLGLSVASHVQRQSQQRIAIMQAEERLDRHSHFDLRVEQLDLPAAKPNSLA